LVAVTLLSFDHWADDVFCNSIDRRKKSRLVRKWFSLLKIQIRTNSF
jgi:hypothetical protein